jgi:class 3 adenylate cyclase
VTAQDGDYAHLQADLHAAISKAVSDHEGAATYVNRFVVLAEIVEGDGERALIQVAADGMTRWDTLGLLDHARSVEWAASATEAD